MDTINGHALTFDPAALRSWLDTRDEDGTTRADSLGIDEHYGRSGSGDYLSVVEDLLAQLREDDDQGAWVMAQAEYVDLFRIWDGEGNDGAIIVVDMPHNVRLASLHQDHKDFGDLDARGVDAAVQALANIAHEANTAAARLMAQSDLTASAQEQS